MLVVVTAQSQQFPMSATPGASRCMQEARHLLTRRRVKYRAKAMLLGIQRFAMPSRKQATLQGIKTKRERRMQI